MILYYSTIYSVLEKVETANLLKLYGQFQMATMDKLKLPWAVPVCEPETDGTISIVSKRSILILILSVSVSIWDIFESRYQSRYRLEGKLSIGISPGID